jgi:hypothetical protein
MLIIVVGLALLPVVTSSAHDAGADPNATSAVAHMVPLIPLFYVLIVLGGALTYVYFRTKG